MRRLAGAALLALLACTRVEERRELVPPSSGMHPAGPLVAGTNLVEEFVSDGAPFDEVAPLLATYARSNASTLEVRLEIERSGRWSTVVSERRPAALLADNAFETFAVPRQSPRRGTRFRLSVSSPDAVDASAVTAWVTRAAPAGVVLSVGGVARDGAVPLVLAEARRVRAGDTVALFRERLGGVVPPWLRKAGLVSAVAAPLLFLAALARLAAAAHAESTRAE